MSAREPQINTKDVVLEIGRKVDRLIEDMADVKVIAATVGVTVETLHDHETRIRVLETRGSESDGQGKLRRYLTPLFLGFMGALWWVPDFLHRLKHG